MPEQQALQETCPDCGVEINELHHEGCDVERCTQCGGQRIGCDCEEDSEEYRRPWTGEWPDFDACRKFDLWCKWVEGKGWVPCSKEDPEAREDLNTLALKCRWDRKKREWVLRK